MNNNVKAYRDRHKYTQAQMGNLLEISKSLISMVENGDRSLTAETEKKFRALIAAETTHKIEDFSSVDHSVNKLLGDHANALAKATKKRIGDLTVQLYKCTNLMQKLKEQTDYALRELLIIKSTNAQYENDEMPTKTTNDLIERRYTADAIIRNVLSQNPELKAAKIHAMNEELDYLINGKVNLNKQLGFDMKKWLIDLPKLLAPANATE